MADHSSITETILSMATSRGKEKTICPSEIARALFPGDWRSQMAQIRDVAVELQKKGKVMITQNGKPIATEDIKGPIRIKIA